MGGWTARVGFIRSTCSRAGLKSSALTSMRGEALPLMRSASLSLSVSVSVSVSVSLCLSVSLSLSRYPASPTVPPLPPTLTFLEPALRLLSHLHCHASPFNPCCLPLPPCFPSHTHTAWIAACCEIKSNKIANLAPTTHHTCCTTLLPPRYRANSAHIRQSGSDFGSGFRAKVVEALHVFPSWFGIVKSLSAETHVARDVLRGYLHLVRA